MVLKRRLKASKLVRPTQTPPTSGGVTRRTAIASIASIAAPVQATRAPASPLLAGASGPNDTFDWVVAEGQPIDTMASQTTPLATGVTGLTARVDPDLPPGHRLTQVGSDVVISVSPDAPNAIDIKRDWTITVMPPQMAVARNLRYPLVWYGHDQSGRIPNTYGNFSKIGYAAFSEGPYKAQPGDVIEISPGYIARSQADQIPSDGKGAVFVLECSVTLKGMDGRGRWGFMLPPFGPADTTFPGIGAILIGRPFVVRSHYPDIADNGCGDFVVQDFDFDGLGRFASNHAIRVISEGGGLWPSLGSWDGYHKSVTLRNFKIGQPKWFHAPSGIVGGARLWVLEDGHLWDMGSPLAASQGGIDHNAYISGRDLVMRGVRCSRTRWMTGTYPDVYPYGIDTIKMDGHALKLGFDNALIEGCAIDCSPGGDQSANIQFYQGGNVTLRSNIITVGRQTNTQRGIIQYCVESNQRAWHYGKAGHSFLMEKNVIMSHYGKPIVWMWPPGDVFGGEWRVYGVRSFVIRDNIAMVNMTNGANGNSYKGPLIANGPSTRFGDAYNTPSWEEKNISIPYESSESYFKEREVLRYLRTDGPLAGTSGVINTYRFKHPHGYEPRSDEYMGLG